MNLNSVRTLCFAFAAVLVAAMLVQARPWSVSSMSATAANACPEVNAGQDTTVRVGYYFRMSASATDDGAPNAALVLAWHILTGPAGGIEILLTDAPRSLVLLKAPGDYLCEFSAYDGECTARDSVRITVLDSIPFTVLRPRIGERIVRGQPYVIEWQIDPPANVLVQFSSDGGDSFTILTRNSIGGTSYTWVPGPDLPLSDCCIIRITHYMQRSVSADSPPFALVDSQGGEGVAQVARRVRREARSRSAGMFTARGQRLPPAPGIPGKHAGSCAYP